MLRYLRSMDNVSLGTDDLPQDERLRRAVLRGDNALATSAPILRHLIGDRDNALFSDAIVAHVGGMTAHVVQQLLSNDPSYHDQHSRLLSKLLEKQQFVTACHAFAIEYRLAERLRDVHDIDPVLTPILQALIGSDNSDLSALGMAVLTSQARFMQQQRRMELPLTELPGELFAVVVDLRNSVVSKGDSGTTSFADYDEANGRMALLDRLVCSIGQGASATLALDHAGVAIFLSGVAHLSQQHRQIIALSTDEGQIARLGVSLRAAGLRAAEIAKQLDLLHSHTGPMAAIEQLRIDQAKEILATSFDPNSSTI